MLPIRNVGSGIYRNLLSLRMTKKKYYFFKDVLLFFVVFAAVVDVVVWSLFMKKKTHLTASGFWGGGLRIAKIKRNRLYSIC